MGSALKFVTGGWQAFGICTRMHQTAYKRWSQIISKSVIFQPRWKENDDSSIVSPPCHNLNSWSKMGLQGCVAVDHVLANVYFRADKATNEVKVRSYFEASCQNVVNYGRLNMYSGEYSTFSHPSCKMWEVSIPGVEPYGNWTANFPTCGGMSQSPINIDSDTVVPMDYSSFSFSIGYRVQQSGILENDGHSSKTFHHNVQWH